MNSQDAMDKIQSLSKPALQIVRSKESKKFSRFGGLPNLPGDISWPEWNGVPLQFLAQIDLSELPKSADLGLPSVGYLFFFYDQEQETWGFDPKDRGSWRVLFSEKAPTTAPIGHRNLNDESVLPSQPIGFREINSLPDPQRVDVSPEIDDELSELFEDRLKEIFQGNPRHQMGGYPHPVQNDSMELECQLVSNGLYCGNSTGYEDPRAKLLQAGADDWQLILQLDTDDDLSVMWGDCGLIYFWARTQDIQKKDFSNSWMILQCG